MLHEGKQKGPTMNDDGWNLKIVNLTLVGEGNETFLIRTWKPLSNRRVLKR